jgi:NADPH-dependent 2,4-dienoyl-CoA reductase/sulfur reductase-like enzyme
VTEILPDQKAVATASGRRLTYDWLVVALGIQIDWAAIPGLADGSPEPPTTASRIAATSWKPKARAFPSGCPSAAAAGDWPVLNAPSLEQPATPE